MKAEPFLATFAEAFRAVFIDGKPDFEVEVPGTEWVFTAHRVQGTYEFEFYLKRRLAEERNQ
jgi:hypothetical protein